MSGYSEYELEIRAAVADLFLSQLARRPDLADAIFDKLVKQFVGKYPHHKLLTHMTIGSVGEDLHEVGLEYPPGELPRLKCNRRRHTTFDEILGLIDEGVKRRLD